MKEGYVVQVKGDEGEGEDVDSVNYGLGPRYHLEVCTELHINLIDTSPKCWMGQVD